MLFRIVVFLFLSSLAFSENITQIPSINDFMSIEDQKKTGVIQLKQSQKMALSQWLIQHGVTPTTQKQPQVSNKQSLILSINIESGKKLVMTDGSLWEISPDDTDTASAWLTSNELEVSASHQIEYPYVLKDKRSGQSVLAKKVS